MPRSIRLLSPLQRQIQAIQKMLDDRTPFLLTRHARSDSENPIEPHMAVPMRHDIRATLWGGACHWGRKPE